MTMSLPREMHLQDPLQCPTPAIDFGHARKPSRFAHFWHNPLSVPGETTTFKSAPNPSVFYAFDLDMCFPPFRHLNSQSGPMLLCFVRFEIEMCFAPQRLSLFRHLNFQKWSDRQVLLAFSLANVLRATTACNFSSFIWPAGSAPAVLASLLFDPPEPQIIGKTLLFRDFPTFSRTCTFFLLTLSLLWSSLFCSSLLWLFPPRFGFIAPADSVRRLEMQNFRFTTVLCQFWCS